MNETRKIEQVLVNQSLDSEYTSLDTFIQKFDSYLHEMNITGVKKKLVMRPEDSLPCLVSINGFR